MPVPNTPRISTRASIIGTVAAAMIILFAAVAQAQTHAHAAEPAPANVRASPDVNAALHMEMSPARRGLSHAAKAFVELVGTPDQPRA